MFGPRIAVRARKVAREGRRRRRRSPRWRLIPQIDQPAAPAWAHAGRARHRCSSSSAMSIIERAAVAYLADRASSTSSIGAGVLQAAEDDQAGGQGRGAADSTPARGQGGDAPPPDAGGARPDDGRGPDRRRGRHQPDPLRGGARATTAPSPPPMVVAKGKDLVAAQIRRIAEENDVPVVPDPPLARSLHATVEIGQMIPAELSRRSRRCSRSSTGMAGRGGRRMTEHSRPPAAEAHRSARRARASC